MAPVTAVVGNMDSGGPTAELPRHVVGEVAGVRFVVGHKRKRLLKDLAAGSIEGLPKSTRPDLVIYGHDHVPAAAWVDGTLYLDPGSASAPHEEDDGPTVAIVEVRPAGLAVTFVPLERREAAEAKDPVEGLRRRARAPRARRLHAPTRRAAHSGVAARPTQHVGDAHGDQGADRRPDQVDPPVGEAPPGDGRPQRARSVHRGAAYRGADHAGQGDEAADAEGRAQPTAWAPDETPRMTLTRPAVSTISQSRAVVALMPGCRAR